MTMIKDLGNKVQDAYKAIKDNAKGIGAAGLLSLAAIQGVNAQAKTLPPEASLKPKITYAKSTAKESRIEVELEGLRYEFIDKNQDGKADLGFTYRGQKVIRMSVYGNDATDHLKSSLESLAEVITNFPGNEIKLPVKGSIDIGFNKANVMYAKSFEENNLNPYFSINNNVDNNVGVDANGVDYTGKSDIVYEVSAAVYDYGEKGLSQKDEIAVGIRKLKVSHDSNGKIDSKKELGKCLIEYDMNGGAAFGESNFQGNMSNKEMYSLGLDLISQTLTDRGNRFIQLDF